MNKNFFKTIILGLVALLIFNIAPPVHADQTEIGISVKMKNLDKKEQQSIVKHLKSLKTETARNSMELSKENKKIARESLKNIESNLVYADINEGEKNIILGTADAKTFVAVTNEIIEVVEQVGEYEFLINGESHRFEVTVTDAVDLSEPSYSLTSEFEDINSGEISIQSTGWTYRGSSWVNINAQRDFHTYTVSALGSVIAAVLGAVAGVGFWGVTLAGLGVGMAYNFVASSQYPTNVGKAHVYRYDRGISPLRDYKTRSYDYAVYQGRNVFLGISERIKKSCVGCGV